MTDTRIHPAFDLGERAMLESWLDFHRATLALKCEGLDDEQLRTRSAPPSTLSLLGLVRHMAEVERAWFQGVLRGEQYEKRFWTEEQPDGDFDNVDTADVAETFDIWQSEVRAARAAAEGVPLEAVGRGLRHGREVTLRWILTHMIEEYARHNGHADLLRERIDGATGE
ncbi:DinB family protein [Peterkaempfera griseoplana]|uniref:DinB family protein n=1 Tax=Peterkaempfera griseoplana TaxID=66896 RepID=UPI0006E27590|nr:DinB family protein [Peterkaempfera griseoplana]